MDCGDDGAVVADGLAIVVVELVLGLLGVLAASKHQSASHVLGALVRRVCDTCKWYSSY